MESSSDLGDKYSTQVSSEDMIDMSSLEEVSHMEQVTNPSKVEFDDVEGNKLNFMDQTWDIIQSFVRDQKNPFTEHQISSFNDFLANPGNNMITKIICEEKQHNPQVMYVDINPETKEPNLELDFEETSIIVPV